MDGSSSRRHTGCFWRVMSVVLPFLWGCAGTQPSPFFAMDTAICDLKQLDTVRALGYDGVGWRTGAPAEISSALRQIRQRGLRLYAVYPAQYPLLTRTGLTLDPYLDSTMEALGGTGAVVWLPIRSELFPASSPDGDSIAVPALRQLADRAAVLGLRVALYPHAYTWTEKVQDAIRLARKVGRQNLGVTFNLCHCLMAGDEAKIPALLAEAMPYLFIVTINGADRAAAGTSWSRLIRPLGEGSYDTGRILRRLTELHYSGPLALQGFGVLLPAEENLARSMAAWRRLSQKETTE